MPCQIDGLVATVIQEYDMNVSDDPLFLFRGGKKDRFKGVDPAREGLQTEGEYNITTLTK